MPTFCEISLWRVRPVQHHRPEVGEEIAYNLLKAKYLLT